MTTDIKILSFDPGLTTSGWTMSRYTKETKIFVVVKCGILTPNRVVSYANMRDEVAIYGKRILTLSLLQKYFMELYEEYEPDYIVTEAAFYNPRRPNAFAALLQWITAIELCLRDNYQKPLYKIAPKSVKQCISGRGDSGKLKVEDAVLNNKNIIIEQENINEFTEHVFDSIAVGYTFVQNILNNLHLPMDPSNEDD